MTELWLKFKDENSNFRKVLVEGDKFTVGRTAENDLTIPQRQISRQHLKIERFEHIYVASDCGSSNGTTINGISLDKPVALKNGDLLNLGGDLEMEVELVSKPAERRPYRRQNSAGAGEIFKASSIPTAVYLAAPVLTLVLLLCGGGLVYVLSDKTNGDTAQKTENYERKESFDSSEEESDAPTPAVSPTDKKTSEGTKEPSRTDDPIPSPTAQINDETKKIERYSAAFLQRIALNHPNAFLSPAEIEIVKSRISPWKGSGTLAENIKAVRREFSQIESLAQSQGLKGQFLAAAALTKLGNKQGNPLETAKQMLPILAELRIALGNNLADDNLLIMADYLRREKKEKPSLQTKLEAIANPKNREKLEAADPATIRTIWYLYRNKKITDEQYEFAVRFLVIGTIMQNPKDFNINAEPVS